MQYSRRIEHAAAVMTELSAPELEALGRGLAGRAPRKTTRMGLSAGELRRLVSAELARRALSAALRAPLSAPAGAGQPQVAA